MKKCPRILPRLALINQEQEKSQPQPQSPHKHTHKQTDARRSRDTQTQSQPQSQSWKKQHHPRRRQKHKRVKSFNSHAIDHKREWVNIDKRQGLAKFNLYLSKLKPIRTVNFVGKPTLVRSSTPVSELRATLERSLSFQASITSTLPKVGKSKKKKRRKLRISEFYCI